jgi:hypothetical protein
VGDDGESAVLFHTSSHAIRAEQLLEREAVACRLVPVPRHLSSDCGVCLRIATADRERVARILAAGKVEVAAMHPL